MSDQLKRQSGLACAAALLSTLSACTAQLPGSVRYAQQKETYSSSSDVNTKVDILWVVDNSSSMDVAQKNLRDGFTSFAQKYMKPSWDIRLAVIPSDLYLANSVFWHDESGKTAYLNRVFGTGVQSTYIQGLITGGKYTDTRNLVDGSGVFTNGLKYNDLVPAWGQNYAKLSTGIHDGPVAAYCQEYMSYFMTSDSKCRTRDDKTRASGTGTALCLNPTNASDSLFECVNTVQNNTMRSGRVIINTKPSTGQTANAAYQQQLIDDFLVNATTGSAGHGSEQVFNSVKQFLTDNEVSSNANRFFRENSLRVIIFVTDEEEQSRNTFPSGAALTADFNPYSDYKCDANVIINANIAKFKQIYLDNHPGASDATAQANATTDVTSQVTGSNGFCCSDGTCKYKPGAYTDSSGNAAVGCPKKTYNSDGTGSTFSPHLCPDPALPNLLLPVSSFKTTLDQFFQTLDGGTSTPNYMIAAIIPKEASTIQNLMSLRNTDDDSVSTVTGVTSLRKPATDRPERIISLVTAVANGSLSLDMGATNYTTVLDQIGASIVKKKGEFTLNFSAGRLDEMIVTINHADGSSTQVPSDKLAVSGNKLWITDETLVLSLSESDSVHIDYQPSSM